MRIGLLAKKMGMTRVFDDLGNHQAVTILECPDAVIISNFGNNRIQLASFDAKPKSLNKAQKAQYEKLKLPYKKHIIEFGVSDASLFQIGKMVSVEHFAVGQYVNIRGKTIGKGFAGAMKRHGFSGLEASHGVSISHRSHGSTGQRQDPGKVFKGKKMAGHLGTNNVTIENLQVIRIDKENSLIFVKGAIPGKKGAVVRVTDSGKKFLPENAAKPAFFKEIKTA